MALFGRTKKSEKTAVAAANNPKTASPHTALILTVLRQPRLTEKTVGLGDARVYAFIVDKNATKHTIKQAVKAKYDVTPVKVRIVNKLPRTTFSRAKGRTVSIPGHKKAYVYLKADDTISLI